MRAPTLCFLFALPLAQLPAQDKLLILDAGQVAAWRDRILPGAAELGFLSIPWLPTFGAGMKAASRQGRPLLFYAMNGHPLGCT